jgi:hypothetical protein
VINRQGIVNLYFKMYEILSRMIKNYGRENNKKVTTNI